MDRYPRTNNLHVSSHSCQTRSGRVAISCALQPTPYLPPTHPALAMTDQASPFALRSTRNHPRTAMGQGRRWSKAVSVPRIAFVEPREQQSPWVVCRLSSGSAERIRAWLVRLATRSGPSTAGSWQACLAGTWLLPLVGPHDDLAPGDPGAIDNHDRHHHHHHHARVGQDRRPGQPGTTSRAECELGRNRSSRPAAVAASPPRTTSIREASRLPKTPPAAPTPRMTAIRQSSVRVQPAHSTSRCWRHLVQQRRFARWTRPRPSGSPSS